MIAIGIKIGIMIMIRIDIRLGIWIMISTVISIGINIRNWLGFLLRYYDLYWKYE